MKVITEIQIIPVKPSNGLIAFVSFILFESIYCSSVGIFTRLDGSYRLVYPTKKIGDKSIDIFHPITKNLGEVIEIEIINKFKDVMKNDRYSSSYN
jgi:stage V sporulation protein G